MSFNLHTSAILLYLCLLCWRGEHSGKKSKEDNLMEKGGKGKEKNYHLSEGSMNLLTRHRRRYGRGKAEEEEGVPV